MKKFSFSIVVVLLFSNWILAADTYTVDPGHSRVGFSVRHMVINKVNGFFREFSGTIVYDPNDPTKSTVNGTIKAASVDTNNADRDEDLRSADFFEVTKYPEITFASKKIEKAGEGYKITGALTMHGVSKDVVLDAKLSGPIKLGPQSRIGIEATTTIDRRDWGLTWSKTLETGGLVVSNEVDLVINAEAAKK